MVKTATIVTKHPDGYRKGTHIVADEVDDQKKKLSEKARVGKPQRRRGRWLWKLIHKKRLPTVSTPEEKQYKKQVEEIVIDSGVYTNPFIRWWRSTTRGVKRFATSTPVIVVAVAMISSVTTYRVAEWGDPIVVQPEDSLSREAVGDGNKEQPTTKPKHSKRVVSNDSIYPNPPEAALDILPPAHVWGGSPMEVRKSTSLAVGDSTVSWSNGDKIDNPIVSCGVEKDTWADMLGMGNIACPGKTIDEITRIIINKKDVVKKSETLFITAGSNDIRGSDISNLDNGLEKLIGTIKSINPKARIIFVGYLPAYIDKACMSMADRNAARKLHSYHRKANYAMQDAALRHKLTYVDVFHSPNKVCVGDKSYVRIPQHHTKGAKWHTTKQGHRHISDVISQVVKMIP